MTRKFWFGVWAGMALPPLWLMRVPLWLGIALLTVPTLLAVPCAKAGLRLMSWDDHLDDVIKRTRAA